MRASGGCADLALVHKQHTICRPVVGCSLASAESERNLCALIAELLSPSAMKIGVEHGMGCYADKLPEGERTQTTIPDQFRHEIATAFNLKGRGLIVLTSCSHRGVINAIKQAQATSGINKVHAVIGGFHLAPYKEDYVRDTVTGMKDMNIDLSFHFTALVSRSARWSKLRCRISFSVPIRGHASFLALTTKQSAGNRTREGPPFRHACPR
jgi:hypothetical protein